MRVDNELSKYLFLLETIVRKNILLKIVLIVLFINFFTLLIMADYQSFEYNKKIITIKISDIKRGIISFPFPKNVNIILFYDNTDFSTNQTVFSLINGLEANFTKTVKILIAPLDYSKWSIVPFEKNSNVILMDTPEIIEELIAVKPCYSCSMLVIIKDNLLKYCSGNWTEEFVYAWLREHVK